MRAGPSAKLVVMIERPAGAVKPAVPALDAASAAYTSALEGFHTAYDELNGY